LKPFLVTIPVPSFPTTAKAGEQNKGTALCYKKVAEDDRIDLRRIIFAINTALLL
jgi:hypothetical protein